jgi:two-component system sensor histidine kinase KdpD
MEHPTPDNLLTRETEQKQAARRTTVAWLGYATRAGKNYLLRLPWREYLQSLGLVVLVSLTGQPFAPYLDHANLVMFYLLAEVIVAARFGLGPSIMAALASVIAFHFFFIVPHFTFALDEAQYLLTFGGLLVSGLVISVLASQAREQANAAQRRERQATISYDFSHSLTAAVGLDEIVQAAISHVKQVFNGNVMILLPEKEVLIPHTLNPNVTLNDQEQTIAAWVFQNGQSAGRDTQMFPDTDIRYCPLKTTRSVIGVLEVRQIDSLDHLTSEQYQLLEIFANQAALAIERVYLAEQAHQTQLLREKENLQSALLNSISHDLRTPMASITGVLSTLYDDAAYLDEATRRDLVENAWEEANRMNRLIANLLDMTRLRAGAMKVSHDLCDIQDLIGAALAELANKLEGRPVTVVISPGLPLVSMDFVLMSRVIFNLLDNARKYSPPDTPIEVRAQMADSWVEIEVTDQGPGIPPEEMPHVFEMFYRTQRSDAVGGTGLGLSICQGIVEAHGGRIWADTRPGGGTIITVALPLDSLRAAETEGVL